MWWMFVRDFYRAAPSGKPLRYAAASSTPFPAVYSDVVADVALDDIPHEAHEIDALKARIAELEQAMVVSDHAREHFLSSMSHELRTPLNAIMGFSDIMKSGVFGEVDNPTYAEYVDHIHESGSSLLDKINNLLNMASLDPIGMELEESEFSVDAMLTDLVAIHTPLAASRQQTITIDCAANIRLLADQNKLRCAISHFITNALRHSNDGGEVRIMARIQPDDGIILSVRDDGEGIGPLQLENIRRALRASDGPEDVTTCGIGIGLSLAHKLAAFHEGRMMIDSLRHRGTVIAMILPKERILAGMPTRKRRS